MMFWVYGDEADSNTFEIDVIFVLCMLWSGWSVPWRPWVIARDILTCVYMVSWLSEVHFMLTEGSLPRESFETFAAVFTLNIHYIPINTVSYLRY